MDSPHIDNPSKPDTSDILFSSPLSSDTCATELALKGSPA